MVEAVLHNSEKSRPVASVTGSTGVGPWHSAAWVASLFCCGLIVALPVDNLVQLSCATILYLVARLLVSRYNSGIWRTVGLFCCAIITFRYVIWRSTNTLGYHDLFGFVAALTLFAAEVYGITLFFLSLVTTILPIQRQTRDGMIDYGDPDLPLVDVLLPTYNETELLLRVTVAAAVAMRYPEGKLRVHLLDDGGTAQKRTQLDPEKAREASARHQALRTMCDELGAIYHTRERNEHAKSGNLNSVLGHLEGELIVVLDADHVPTVDFLERTVGHFKRDPRLFLVQTPHFFINPDPFERNLGSFSEMPAESTMFYRVIQKGLDYWNAAIFCGSAAVLRRRCLLEIGGFAQQTITEDAETAMELHARGYHSAYIDRPLISGLSPESFESFLIQRSRWGTGMLQILLLKRPLSRTGLSLWQRLSYFSSSLFWFFPIPRIIFLIGPTLYLLFGLRVYDTNTIQFLSYTLPHLAASGLASKSLFGRYRWPFVSMIYETMLSLFMLRGVIGTIRSPKAPLFKVTPKGSTFGGNFVSPFAKPYYVVLGVMLLAAGMGTQRLLSHPTEPGVIVITMAWNFLNFFVLTMALGGMLEQRQQRKAHRIDVDLPATLFANGQELAARIIEFSVLGASLKLAKPMPQPASHVSITLMNDALGRPVTIDAVTRRFVKNRGREGAELGLEFVIRDRRNWTEVVTLVHGDSERWRRIWECDGRDISGWRLALKFIVFTVTRFNAHLFMICLDIFRLMRHRRLVLWFFPKSMRGPAEPTSRRTVVPMPLPIEIP